MTQLRKIIRDVLSQLANSQEARYYLKQFSQKNGVQFAVIKVGGGILENKLKELASTLATILHLGLYPVVIHGAGSQIDQAISKESLESKKIDGLRVTDEKIMSIARPIIYKLNRDLVTQIKKHDVEAVSIQHGVFEAEYENFDKYGLVGKIKSIDLNIIHEAIEQGIMPIISCLGETSSGQVVNINADFAARELAWALKPRKIIYITPSGGLLNEKNEIISSISLLNDYQSLMQKEWLHSGMRLKLEQIYELLDPLPNTASVSITSVNNLLKELFTHRGAGTLVNKGEQFDCFKAVTEDQKQALQKLMIDCFDEELVDDYFEGNCIDSVIINETGSAAAIILKGQDNVHYLDKFAVSPNAQGFGYAGVLWRMIKNTYPQLYWRSRVNNPISLWYFQKSNTAHKQGAWYGFSYGIEDANLNKRCLSNALQRELTWKKVS